MSTLGITCAALESCKLSLAPLSLVTGAFTALQVTFGLGARVKHRLLHCCEARCQSVILASGSRRTQLGCAAMDCGCATASANLG